MRLVVIDNCAVPTELAELVTVLKQDVKSAQLDSMYRGDDAAALLHKHGKHTQRELSDAWIAWRDHGRITLGFKPNPANPPDRGTHLLIGDGTVGALHEKLDVRQCGMDWNDGAVSSLISAAAKRGWDLYRPYSGGSEYHHLCARDWPALGAVLGMKRGTRRGSVGDLARRLAYVGQLDEKYVHTVFDEHVQAGVIRYQKHAGIKPDGLVGPATWAALDRSVTRKKAKK